ncbi:hypothetical protein BU14_1465s0003 [Porphyra umbilicalis]|uniref:Uncharacterized protein n=1 Tax=Porphyra umbilicalis TaxID=2786 RepID=A0A1X6NLY9_PORUM|nr:hypothetical protein BU14_1465s0003 [Porphyra umbilicalis]|eukprot:OSX69486.1 hypothetical protein BU14_1465s0003 [Porphyra umbilicalis]
MLLASLSAIRPTSGEDAASDALAAYPPSGETAAAAPMVPPASRGGATAVGASRPRGRWTTMEAAVRTGLQHRDCSTTLHTTHQWCDSQAAHNPPARPSSPQVLDRPRRNTKGRRWRRRPHAKRTPTCAAASVQRPEHRGTARPSHRKGSVTHSETGTPTAAAPREGHPATRRGWGGTPPNPAPSLPLARRCKLSNNNNNKKCT